MPRVFSVVTLVLTLVCANDAMAQRGTLNPRQVGLETAWSRAVLTGLGGEVTGVTVHVSPTKSYATKEVVDRHGRRTYFSGRELGTSRGGYNQMQRLAELRTAQLEARGLAPQTESKEVPEVTLYIRSNLGVVTAIDAETGNEKWTTEAGKAGYPSYGVAANDQHVAVISSTTLYLLDAVTGQVLESLDSDFLPANTPTIDGPHVYLPTRKGVVRILSTDNLNRMEYTLGSSGAIVSPLTVGSDTVSWTTDRGFLYVAKAGQPGTKFRFQAADDIVAAPVFMDGKLFAVSLDGFVYGVSEANGDTLWNHSAGGPVSTAPMAVAGNVFVTTDDGQATCIDASAGSAKWTTSGIEQFVAVSESRLYCQTSGGDLAVLDVSTGGRIAASPINGIGTVAVNSNTDRVYVVGNNGVLHCLREQGQRWPIARVSPRAAAGDVETEESGEVVASTPDQDVVVPSAENEEPVEDFGSFEAEDAADTDAEADLSDEDDPFAEEGFGDDGFDDMGDDDLGMDDENPFGNESSRDNESDVVA